MGERKLKLNARDQELPEFYEISVEKFYDTFESSSYNPRETPFFGFDSKHLSADGLFHLVNRAMKHRVGKKHTMLVGPMGCGKTTTVLNIATSIIVDQDVKKKPETDFMIFLFDSRDYRPNEKLSAVEFLQRSQRSENAMGITWNHLRTHSEKALFVLDSLDKMLTESDRDKKIEIHDCYKSEALSVHIFNILSGDIFPNSTIFTATRPYAVEHFEGKIRPDKVITVGNLASSVMRNMMYYYLEEAQNKKMEAWEDRLPMQVISKTPWLFRNCYDSVRFDHKHCYPRSAAAIMINLLTGNLKYDRFSLYGEEKVLAAIDKMKSLALMGFQEGRFTFTDEDLFKTIKFKKKELNSFSLPIKKESGMSPAVFETEKDRNYFLAPGLQEFFCALKIIEMDLPEFKTFVSKHIHTHRYSTVRQLLCGVLMCKTTYEEALRMVLKENPDDELKKDFFRRSMRDRFLQLERQNLLEFFQSVVAIEDKNRGVLPAFIDVLDLSSIPMFIRDVTALSMCLRDCKRISFLNLAGCSLNTYAISCLSNILVEWDIKIEKLCIDRNPIEWSDAIVQSFSKFIRKCHVHHLSMNCCNLTSNLLGTLHIILEGRKMKSFRASYNKSLDLDAFTFLGHFIMSHGVQELFLHGCDMSPRNIEELKSPRCFKSCLVETEKGDEAYIHTFAPAQEKT